MKDRERPRCAVCDAEKDMLIMKPNTAFWVCMDCDRQPRKGFEETIIIPRRAS